jgi:pentatricopeptide repeat protein
MWGFLNGIALAHFSAGRYEEAVVWEQRSLQRNPEHYVSLGTLASSHAHLGQLDQARSAFQEMLRRNPEFSPESFKMLFSIANSAFIESWLDGLRKAGWEG